MEYYAAERKKELLPLGQHGWNWRVLCLVKEAGGKRQIPYDLTYKWNIINKQRSKIEPEAWKQGTE